MAVLTFAKVLALQLMTRIPPGYGPAVNPISQTGICKRRPVRQERYSRTKCSPALYRLKTGCFQQHFVVYKMISIDVAEHRPVTPYTGGTHENLSDIHDYYWQHILSFSTRFLHDFEKWTSTGTQSFANERTVNFSTSNSNFENKHTMCSFVAVVIFRTSNNITTTIEQRKFKSFC